MPQGKNQNVSFYFIYNRVIWKKHIKLKPEPDNKLILYIKNRKTSKKCIIIYNKNKKRLANTSWSVYAYKMVLKNQENVVKLLKEHYKRGELLFKLK